MEKIELSEDIFQYNNFITDFEAKSCIDLLNLKVQKNEMKWHDISFYESYSSGYPQPNDPDMIASGLPGDFFIVLEQRFKEVTAIAQGLDPKNMHKIGFHTQKWAPGAYAHYHSDNSSNDGTESAFTRSRYATFLYLNDDYDGGLINFKANYGEKVLSIKPKTGMLLTFHGGFKNLHEVTVVKKSNRYTIGSFWDDRAEEDYPQDIRDKWAKELAETRRLQEEQYKEWGAIRENKQRLLPNGKIIDELEVL